MGMFSLRAPAPPPASSPPPALTPAMHSLPPLASTSPAGAFVSVFTPTAASANPTTEEIDVNGIKVGAWSAELHSRDTRSAYFWAVACCPCVPVAQLEVRLGLAPYGRALLRHTFATAVFLAFFLANVATLVRLFRGDRVFWAELVLLAALALTAVLTSRRVAQLRTEVRTRFQIDGSVKDDQYVAMLHSSRAIRQMGKHLQCDRAYFSRAPATLQAYQV